MTFSIFCRREKSENHILKAGKIKKHNTNFKTVQPYKAPYLPASLITCIIVCNKYQLVVY